ncbi:MAG: histone deacetylase [Chloroflexi bacterium]|nr:histone deacetylase [Chloroflexota bacterium]
MTTAYLTHLSFTEHDFPRHPEHAGRIQAVWSALEKAGLADQLLQLAPAPATDEEILAVHSATHLQRLVYISQSNREVLIDQDTYALPCSLDVSRLAAGAMIGAVDAVCAGDADNALAIVRPPGHHATLDRQMGFCLLNNVAIGARHALTKHQLQRVMILDYDVHHGNGTQDIFYSDPAVMFLSIHQSPHYPGTGRLDDVGESAGKGTTLNIPVAAGHGDRSYRLMFEQVVIPATERFRPDLILISVGFDAHWADPLAGMHLSLGGYDWLARQCLKLAKQVCAGRIVFLMEGGYDLKALSHGWCNIARALLDREELSDPYGAATEGASARDIQSLINRVRVIHGI